MNYIYLINLIFIINICDKKIGSSSQSRKSLLMLSAQNIKMKTYMYLKFRYICRPKIIQESGPNAFFYLFFVCCEYKPFAHLLKILLLKIFNIIRLKLCHTIYIIIELEHQIIYNSYN